MRCDCQRESEDGQHLVIWHTVPHFRTIKFKDAEYVDFDVIVLYTVFRTQ